MGGVRRSLSSLSACLVLCSLALLLPNTAFAEPTDGGDALLAATRSTIAENLAQSASNSLMTSSAACVVSPTGIMPEISSDPQKLRRVPVLWYGAGTHNPQGEGGQVVTRAADYATFQATCEGSASFVLTATFTYQYFVGDTWIRGSSEMTCAQPSNPSGQSLEIATLIAPGASCGSTQFVYAEHDVSLSHPHRLQIEITTGLIEGPSVLGWSLPWTSECIGGC